MFHGPLVYLMGGYAGHTPFTERDIDLFLSHYAPNEELARSLKDDFQKEAREKIYPAMTDRHCEWGGAESVRAALVDRLPPSAFDP